jgi:hypothetical protein
MIIDLNTSTVIITVSIIVFVVMVVVFSILFFKLSNRKKKIKEKVKSSNVVALKRNYEKEIDKLKKETIKLKEDKEYIKKFDAIRSRKSKFNLKYWISHYKDKWFPQKTVLINMELANGMHKQFITLIKKDNTFKYRGKLYLVDNESKYYVIDSKIWAYDFHEDFTLPIKRKIPLIKIKKSIEHSGISEVEYMMNPSTLERFTISKIAEGIMRGQQIDEFFKRIQLLMIITMVAAVIHLVLFMFKSGMLQQIKIPGVTG